MTGYLKCFNQVFYCYNRVYKYISFLDKLQLILVYIKKVISKISLSQVTNLREPNIPSELPS